MKRYIRSDPKKAYTVFSFSPQRMRNRTVDSKKKMAEENSVINLLPRTFAKYKWWFLVSGVLGKEEMLRNLTGETSLGKLLPTGQSNATFATKAKSKEYW